MNADIQKKPLDHMKDAATQLREVEERLYLGLDGSNVGLWDWDITTGEVIYIRHWAEILGYSGDEIDEPKRMWQKCIHPDDRERMTHALSSYIEGQSSQYEAEHRMLAKSGAWRWMLSRGKAIDRDEEGRATRMVGMHVDITETKRTEHALRESEERYRILYENIPSMYFTLDEEGTILSVNSYGADCLGYGIEELAGHSVLKVFHEEDRKPVQAQLAAVLQNPNEVAKWQFRKICKDGTLIWVEETVRAIKDTSGKTVVLVVCEDVSERRKLQHEMMPSR